MTSVSVTLPRWLYQEIIKHSEVKQINFSQAVRDFLIEGLQIFEELNQAVDEYIQLTRSIFNKMNLPQEKNITTTISLPFWMTEKIDDYIVLRTAASFSLAVQELATIGYLKFKKYSSDEILSKMK